MIFFFLTLERLCITNFLIVREAPKIKSFTCQLSVSGDKCLNNFDLEYTYILKNLSFTDSKLKI